jgi:hypothetical protein
MLACRLRNWQAGGAATAVRLLYNSCMTATHAPFEHDCRVVARRIDFSTDAQDFCGPARELHSFGFPKLHTPYSGLQRAALISPRSSTVEVISYHHIKRRQHRCTGALHSCIPRSVRLTAQHHSMFFSSLVSGPSYLLYTRSIHSSDTRILHLPYLEVRVRYLAVIINTCQ